MKLITQNRPTYTSAAQRKVDQADARTRFALERFRDAQIKEFREFWNQPRQDIIDQLAIRGNKALAAFTMHHESKEFVIAQGIAYDSADYTPPYAYTIHTSGELAGHITLD
jgi:hypothetical protein